MIDSLAGEAPATLASLVSRIAHMLEDGRVLGSGDASSLRRMEPRHPEAAFFKLEGLVLDDQLPGDAKQLTDLETRWGAVVVGLAHLGGLHRPGLRLGRALANARWSEHRFVRLVRADAERLADELPSLAKFLRAKGVSVDWTGAAQLILTAGTPNEEPTRRHLARDYYGALAHLEEADVDQNKGVQ